MGMARIGIVCMRIARGVIVCLDLNDSLLSGLNIIYPSKPLLSRTVPDPLLQFVLSLVPA